MVPFNPFCVKCQASHNSNSYRGLMTCRLSPCQKDISLGHTETNVAPCLCMIPLCARDPAYKCARDINNVWEYEILKCRNATPSIFTPSGLLGALMLPVVQRKGPSVQFHWPCGLATVMQSYAYLRDSCCVMMTSAWVHFEV